MYQKYNGMAVSYANSIMHDHPEAEDIVSDSWMVVVRQNDIRPETFWGYLRLIVKLKCKDTVRNREARKRRLRIVPISDEVITEIDPLRNLCDKETLLESLGHGTLWRYRNQKCRCFSCRKANSDYQREYQGRLAQRKSVGMTRQR